MLTEANTALAKKIVPPRHRLREGPIPASTAYQLIHDELMLDDNARLNLATFVTTWMEPQAELLMAECVDREHRRSARRIKAAGFPREKWLADFDFAANPAINPATISTLASCAWVKAGEPLCLIGDSGTGKTHLLIALGTAAAEQGYRVRYTLATKLVNELVEAADERQLARTIARYGRVDLLCIDELGYMELDRRGAELLFQVLTEREETASVAIASNESFSGWTKTFTDPRLCAAIVDRLTFAGNIIETDTSSYRLAYARSQRAAASPTRA